MAWKKSCPTGRTPGVEPPTSSGAIALDIDYRYEWFCRDLKSYRSSQTRCSFDVRYYLVHLSAHLSLVYRRIYGRTCLRSSREGIQYEAVGITLPCHLFRDQSWSGNRTKYVVLFRCLHSCGCGCQGVHLEVKGIHTGGRLLWKVEREQDSASASCVSTAVPVNWIA